LVAQALGVQGSSSNISMGNAFKLKASGVNPAVNSVSRDINRPSSPKSSNWLGISKKLLSLAVIPVASSRAYLRGGEMSLRSSADHNHLQNMRQLKFSYALPPDGRSYCNFGDEFGKTFDEPECVYLHKTPAGDYDHHSGGSFCTAYARSDRVLSVVNFDTDRPWVYSLSLPPDFSWFGSAPLGGITPEGVLLNDMTPYCATLMQQEDAARVISTPPNNQTAKSAQPGAGQHAATNYAHSPAYQVCLQGKHYFSHWWGYDAGGVFANHDGDLVVFGTPGEQDSDSDSERCTTTRESDGSTSTTCTTPSCTASAFAYPIMAVLKNGKLVHGEVLKTSFKDYVVDLTRTTKLNNYCHAYDNEHHFDSDAKLGPDGFPTDWNATAPQTFIPREIDKMCEIQRIREASIKKTWQVIGYVLLGGVSLVGVGFAINAVKDSLPTCPTGRRRGWSSSRGNASSQSRETSSPSWLIHRRWPQTEETQPLVRHNQPRGGDRVPTPSFNPLASIRRWGQGQSEEMRPLIHQNNQDYGGLNPPPTAPMGDPRIAPSAPRNPRDIVFISYWKLEETPENAPDASGTESIFELTEYEEMVKKPNFYEPVRLMYGDQCGHQVYQYGKLQEHFRRESDGGENPRVKDPVLGSERYVYLSDIRRERIKT